jgi:hypothetical protein
VVCGPDGVANFDALHRRGTVAADETEKRAKVVKFQWSDRSTGSENVIQQASSGVVIETPGSTMPPRLPISVPP